MRLLHVHIGLHKTGTTSIQWYLNRHARKLAAHGLYVPQSGCPSPRACGHHNIAWTLLGRAQARADLGDLSTLLTELERVDSPHAVISSEDFVHLAERPDTLRGFDAALTGAGWSPRYILFLRQPGAYALSLYGELCKQGANLSFHSFLNGAQGREGPAMRQRLGAHLDFERLTRHWRDATSGELRILSYEAAAAQGGVIPAFIAALGLPPAAGRLRQRRLNVTCAPASPDMHEAAQWIEEQYGAAYRQLTATSPQPPTSRPRLLLRSLGFAG